MRGARRRFGTGESHERRNFREAKPDGKPLIETLKEGIAERNKKLPPDLQLPMPMEFEEFEAKTEIDSGNPWPVTAASLAGKPAPPRAWHVPG